MEFAGNFEESAWVKSGRFSSYDFGRDISLFHELNSLIRRINSLLVYLGNLAGNPIVPEGYRGVKFTD